MKINLILMTTSEENYLKVIYHLSLVSPKGVNTNAIAGMLDTKASSVTDMLKKLSDKELVAYQKYQGVTLTSKGFHLAKMIVRKHRLWEVFLVDKLNFSWDEVHDIAEELEHIKSDSLINKLDKFSRSMNLVGIFDMKNRLFRSAIGNICSIEIGNISL